MNIFRGQKVSVEERTNKMFIVVDGVTFTSLGSKPSEETTEVIL